MNSPAKHTYNAAIVGLGTIGMLYDYATSDKSTVLTHATAYTAHRSYNLVGGVDTDSSKRNLFERKFQKPAFKNIKELSQAVENIDIMSVAVPEEVLCATACDAISSMKLKALLLEKPGSSTLHELNKFNDTCSESDVILFVNYFRRVEPGVIKLKEFIDSGQLGSIKKVIFKYANGFMRNASHFINLSQFIFGPLTERPKLIKVYSENSHDFCADVLCQFNSIDVYFHYIDEKYFRYYQGEIIGEQGVIFYKKTGREIVIMLPEEDKIFPDFSYLSDKGSCIETDYSRFQYHVMDHMYHHLNYRAPNMLSGQSALETFHVLSDVHFQHITARNSHNIF